MTVHEYMSPQLFPLTTQPGLTLEQQMTLDAVNYDEYEESRTAYDRLSDHERAVGRELEAKNAARDSVLRQVQGRQDTSSGSVLGANGRPVRR